MKLHRVSVAALLGLSLVLFGLCELGLCMEEDNIIRMKLGRVHDFKGTSNIAEVESLGRFAVQEHNKKQNALLEFARVLRAEEQVVAGKIYYLTLEAIEAGKKKIYEAKIWVKPWMNFKQLQEFKQAHGISPFRTFDLGVKQEDHKLHWREVPIHDPEVKDAANHVIKSIAQRSNSLSPYELLEVVFAKAKVIEDYVKFDLLLKVRQGLKEERFRAEVDKKLGGKFYVNQMEQDRS